MIRDSVVKVRGIEKLSKAELRALSNAAKWIGVKTDWLATVISFETNGTFSPKVPNSAGSGARGLIQFMPDTMCRLLGLKITPENKKKATKTFERMSFTRQLEEVKKYFAPRRGKLHSLEDLYLAIFYPAEINRKPDDVIAHADSTDKREQAIYRQNRGFDREKKGYITRGDVTATIIAKLNAALKTGERIAIPAAVGFGTIALGGAGAILLYQMRVAAHER